MAKRRRSLGEAAPSLEPPPHEATSAWGANPLDGLSEEEKAAASSALDLMLTQSEKEAQALLERCLGIQIGTIFEVMQKASLEGEFGGLIPIDEKTSAPLIQVWLKQLEAWQKEGVYTGEIPRAFVPRMMKDGSLVIKAIHLPKGLVLPSTGVVSQVTTDPRAKHNKRLEEWSESDEEKSRRSL